MTQLDYANNCVYWIREILEGRTSPHTLREVTKNLRDIVDRAQNLSTQLDSSISSAQWKRFRNIANHVEQLPYLTAEPEP